MLIAGRVLMGASAAASRVLVVAMVRDLFEAEAMARVMSLVFMTFMLVPVLAPNIGQLILLFAPWRAIFLVLAVYALFMVAWPWVRMPETLHPEFRRPLKWRAMGEAIVEAVRERQSRGYTLAVTVSFSGLVAYISSIQQIIFDTFHEGRYIGLVFASIAAPMALASYLNSRVVGRFGLRRVGHSAALAMVVITAAHAAIALAGFETLPLFIVFQGLTMACFAFTSSNLGTLAMENMAPIAGTASSVQGVVGTIGAAAIGFVIGQQFDGTAMPFVVGTAACAAGGFLLIVLTEPKRLFAPIRISRATAARVQFPAVPEEVAASCDVILPRCRRRRQDRRRPSKPRRLPLSSADRILDPLGDVWIFLEVDLGVLAALADPNAVVAEPGARLLDQPGLDSEVEDFADLANAFAVHDVELDLLERRRDLVLDYLHAGRIADDVVAILDLAGAADVEADRGVEFQRIAAGRRLRIAVHDADLHPHLVDEDDGGCASG